MSNYDVKIWQTAQLNGAEGTTPKQRAKTYIEGAFGKIPADTVDVTLASESVDAPTQDPDESFEAPYPCDFPKYGSVEILRELHVRPVIL